MFKSIKQKILLPQISLMLLVVFILGIANYFLVVSYVNKEQRRNLRYMLGEEISHIEKNFSQRAFLLESIAKGEEVKIYSERFTEPVIFKYFTGFEKEFPVLTFVNNNGDEEIKIVKNKRSGNLQNIRDTYVFQKAVSNPNKVIISQVEYSNDLKTPVVNFAVANYEYFGDRFLYLIIGSVPVFDIIKHISELKLGETGFVIVIDRQRNIISAKDYYRDIKKITVKGKKAEDLISEATALKEGFGRGNILSRDSFIAYTPFKDREWSIMVIMSYKEFMQAPNSLIVSSILIFIPIFIFSVYIILLLANHLTDPIKKLVTITNDISEGDFSKRVDIESTDEIGILGKSFNSMVKKLQNTTVSRNFLLQEIKERQKAENELKEYAKKIEDINKELDDFTYIVSHDLKEPLRSISAFSKFVISDYKDKLDEDGKGYLERINVNSILMQNLIGDLLEISRIERRKNPFEDTDVANMINEVRIRLEHSITEKKVEIVVSDKFPVVYCDRVRLTEVFANLVSNAIKYADKIPLRIEIGWSEKVDFYEFYVKDNGPGIPEEYFEKIFKIFQRLVKREEKEGTGVGLTIAKKIVEMHKGRIWVKSKVGEGATFYFTIPRSKNIISGKKKIGEILVERKIVDEDTIKKALEEQKKKGV